MRFMLGEENIDKMKKQKDDLEELREDIVEQERRRAGLQVQQDILKKEYEAVVHKKNQFKTELMEIKRKNVKIERKI